MIFLLRQCRQYIERVLAKHRPVAVLHVYVAVWMDDFKADIVKLRRLYRTKPRTFVSQILTAVILIGSGMGASFALTAQGAGLVILSGTERAILPLKTTADCTALGLGTKTSKGLWVRSTVKCIRPTTAPAPKKVSSTVHTAAPAAPKPTPIAVVREGFTAVPSSGLLHTSAADSLVANIEQRLQQRLSTAQTATASSAPSLNATSLVQLIRSAPAALRSGKDGQVLSIENGSLVWLDLPGTVSQTRTTTVRYEYGGNSYARPSQGGGVDQARVEAGNGQIKVHDHQSDPAGGVLDINAATRGTLAVSKGGTGISSYGTGDLLVGNGSHGLSALGKGSNGQVLVVSASGGLAWSSTVSGNLTQSAADALYLNVSGDTMSGALRITSAGVGLSVTGTISGSTIRASSLLASSGALVIQSSVQFRSLVGCSGIQTDASGNLSCATGLTQSSLDSRYVNVSGDTMTGALVLTPSGGSGALALRIVGRQTLTGSMILQASAAGVKPLVIKGAVGQTANLQEWQDSAGTALAVVDKNGSATFSKGGTATLIDGTTVAGFSGFWSGSAAASPSSTNFSFLSNGSTVTALNVPSGGATQLRAGGITALVVSDASTAAVPRVIVGYNPLGTAGDTAASLSVLALNSTYKPIVARGAASQTANLQEWQDSAGTMLAKVLANGNISTTGTLSGKTLTIMNGTSYLMGNVGIGTTSPSDKLVVAGHMQLLNSGNIIKDFNGNNLIGNIAGTLTVGNGAVNVGGVFLVGAASDISFKRSTTTDMFIQGSSGNVGIGTTSPTYRLDVSGSSAGMNLFRAVRSATNRGILLTSDGYLTATGVGGSTSTNRQFLFTVETPLNVESGMGVGAEFNIGLAPNNWASFNQPQTSVLISGTVNQTGTSTSATRGLYINQTITSALDYRALDIGNDANFAIYQSGANAKNYFAGNVGIGTTGPGSKLEIYGASRGIRFGRSEADSSAAATTSLTFANSYLHLGGREYTANSYRFLSFGYQNGTATNIPAYIGYQELSTEANTYGDLIFGTRSVHTDTLPSERMRITNTGNVGIGTTNPGAKLDVAGTISGASLRIAGSSTLNGALVLTPTGGSGALALRIVGRQTLTGSMILQASAAAVKPLIVKGAVGQTANLQEWQNSAGTVGAVIDAGGQLRIGTNSATLGNIGLPSNGAIWARNSANNGDNRILTFGQYNGGASTDSMTIGGGNTPNVSINAGTYIDLAAKVGVNNDTPGAQLHIISSAVGVKGLVVQGAASQTADFFQLQHSSGSILQRVDRNGRVGIGIGGSATLGAATLANFGDFSIWNTNNMFTAFMESRGGYYWTELASNNATGSASAPLMLVGSRVRLTTANSDASRIEINESGLVGINQNTPTSQLQINTKDASTVGQIIKGIASQTANLLELQNSAGTILSSFSNSGALSLISSSVNEKPLVIKGAASQSANLTEWQNSAGQVNSKLSVGGQATFGYSSVGPVQNAGLEVYSPSAAGLYVAASASPYYGFSVSTDTTYTTLRSVNTSLKLQADNSFSLTTLAPYTASPISFTDVSGGLNGVNGNTAFTNLTATWAPTSTASNFAILKLTGTINETGTATGNYTGLLINAIETAVLGTANKVIDLQVNSASVFSVSSKGAGILNISSPSAIGLIVKGAASQTANLQEWQNASADVLFKIDANGNLLPGSTATKNVGSASLRLNNIYSYSLDLNVANAQIGVGMAAPIGVALAINTSSPTWNGMIIKGAASQTANLLELWNSAGTILSSFSSSGALTISPGNNVSLALNVRGAMSGASLVLSPTGGSGATALRIVGKQTLTGSVVFQSSAAGTKPLIVKGAVGQTANLQEWQNSAGTVVLNVMNGGQINALSTLSVGGGVTAQLNTSLYALFSQPTVATAVPIVSRGAANQTANLQEWQNSAGTVLASVHADGSTSWGAGAVSTYANVIGGPTKGTVSLAIVPSTHTAGDIGLYGTFGAIAGNYSPFNMQGTASGELLGLIQNNQTNNSTSHVRFSASTNATGGNPMFNWNILSTTNWQMGIDNADSDKLKLSSDASGFLTNSTTQTWTRSGLIGMGTVNPAARLQVVAASGASKGMIVQGAASQTADLFQLQNSAATVLASFSNSGALTLLSSSVNQKPLIIRGTTAQSANLQEWQNSAGTSLLQITSAGYLQAQSFLTLQSASSYIQFNSQGANAGYYDNGNFYRSTDGVGSIGLAGNRWAAGYFGGVAGTVPMTIKGAGSQTADLQQWQNSAGSVLAVVSSNGSIVAGGSPASTYGSVGNLGVIPGGSIFVALATPINLAATPSAAGGTLSTATYYYKISAFAGISRGESLASTEVSASVTGPTGSVSLSWPRVSGASLYRIYRGTTPGGENESIDIGNFLSYTDTGASWVARTLPTVPAGFAMLMTADGISSGQPKLARAGDENSQMIGLVPLEYSWGSLFRVSLGRNAGGFGNQQAIVAKTVDDDSGYPKQNSHVSINVASTGALNTNVVFYVGTGNDATNTRPSAGFANSVFTGPVSGGVPGAQLHAKAGTGTTKGLIVQGAANQSVNLQEWQNSAGTVLTYVDKYGTVRSTSNSYGFHYNDAGSNVGRMSIYTDGAGTIGGIFRGYTGQTADLLQLQNSAGTILSSFSNSGALSIVSSSVNEKPLIIKAAASQSANLTEWQNSNGSVMAAMTTVSNNAGYLKIFSNGEHAQLGFSDIPSNKSGVIGVYTTSDTGTVPLLQFSGSTSVGGTIYTRPLFGISNAGISVFQVGAKGDSKFATTDATAKGLIVQGFTAQTANLQEWQDSAGTVLLRVGPTGTLTASVGITFLNNASITSQNGTSYLMYVGTSSVPQNLLVAGAADRVPIAIKGAASQTANLQEWQRSDGVVVASMSGTGALTTSGAITIRSNETNTSQDSFKIITNYSTTGNTVFRVSASGSVFADGVYNSAGADYAEYFYTSDTNLQPGEVVCIDVLSKNAVKRCTKDGDSDVIGIVSTRPSFVGNVLSGADGLPVPGTVLVGLIGQVPAKVIVTGTGAIHAGDQLTAAAVPGYARKAVAGEATVGVALEPFNDSGVGTIKVLISRRNQSLSGEMVDQRVLDSIAAMKIEDEVKLMVQSTIDAFDLNDSVTTEVTRQVKTLDLAGQINALIQARVGSGQLLSATALDDIRSQVRLLSDAQSGSFLRLSDLTMTMSNRFGLTASGTSLIVHRPMTISNDLFVSGGLKALSLTINQLAVSGDATVGGTLHAAAFTASGSVRLGSGATISGSLKTSTLSVSSGAVIRGGLMLSGPLSAGSGFTLGSMSVSGSTISIGSLINRDAMHIVGGITIDGLATFFGVVDIRGELRIPTKQAGYAVIPKTGTSVTVRFQSGYTLVPIVTASPDVPVLYGVSKATATGFTIRLSGPAVENITFSWLAMPTEKPETSTAVAQSGAVIAFPVESDGTPISRDVLWNACIRGDLVTDSTGNAYDCGRYHQGDQWHHPDLNLAFLYNRTSDPKVLTVPDGYQIIIISQKNQGSSQNIGSGSPPPLPPPPPSDVPPTGSGSDVPPGDGSGSGSLKM